jgi:pimeloyl-ACP methyl ester carboxylesterase
MSSLDDVGMGEPVVLIHGLACGKRMWFHQIRALRERFRVIAYDQRGHGLTDAPADPKHYSPSHLVRDLSGLLDALGIAPASIVGFSLGGGPALGLAASAPHRISRLVLADIGAGADNMWKSQWLAAALERIHRPRRHRPTRLRHAAQRTLKALRPEQQAQPRLYGGPDPRHARCERAGGSVNMQYGISRSPTAAANRYLCATATGTTYSGSFVAGAPCTIVYAYSTPTP